VSEEEREYLNEMIRSLNNRLIDALRERDEARRFACMMAAGKEGKSSSASPDAIAYAQERGWDCFKENCNDKF
jgi:hypothetical protein